MDNSEIYNFLINYYNTTDNISKLNITKANNTRSTTICHLLSLCKL